MAALVDNYSDYDLPVEANRNTPDVGQQIVGFVLDKQFSIDVKPKVSTIFPQDPLGKTLDQYMFPLLTGNDHALERPVQRSGTHRGLITPTITNAMITSFFRNFAPLYPIVDEFQFRALYQQYVQNESLLDKQSKALVFMVLAVGGAIDCEATSSEQTARIRVIRESLFNEALSISHLLYGHGKLVNVQVLVLFSFYSYVCKNLSNAWLWCGCAIRLLKTFSLRGNHPSSNDEAAKDRLLWSIFILEKQLALLQLRSDMMLSEDDVNDVGEDVKERNLILFIRVQFAHLIHRYCLQFQGSMNPIDLADTVEQLYTDISAWRNTLPAGYQPECDTYADPSEYQFVLLMHLEYHGLLLAMFTSLETSARMLSRYINVKKHSSIRIRNQPTISLNNARRLLHTVREIVDTAHLTTKVTYWLNSIQVIPAFSMLYAHVLKRPTLLSARSDAELLSAAARIFDHYMANTPKLKTMSGVVTKMAISASNLVTNPQRPSNGSEKSVGSADTSNSGFSPAMPLDTAVPLESLSRGSPNTPLSFYFNMAPELLHQPSNLDSMTQLYNPPQATSVPDDFTQIGTAAVNLLPGDWSMDASDIWYPSC